MSSWRSPGLGPMPHTSLPTTGVPSSAYSPANGSTNAVLEQGPRAKCDQVVFEAIAKAAEIVVGSRCWIDHHHNQQQHHPHNQHQHPQYPHGGVPSSSSGSSSSNTSLRRFNLLVPEVQGVRSILQRWRRALHVPLRLDVYYQHPDSRRELLERWCLEYAPKSAAAMGFRSAAAPASTDPIVQLRQVCKQIVVWLRSLYCWSRMLPAMALRSQNTHNSAIGFSIYVVSEGNDDVSGLVSQQGFLDQGQPHSVLTPYGELGWKVFYAPQSVVQRLLPKRSPYSHHTSANAASSSATPRSASQPIPMRAPQQQPPQQQQHALPKQQPSSYHHQPLSHQYAQQEELRRQSYHPPSAMAQDPSVVAQSAPGDHRRTMYHRSHSDNTDFLHHANAVAQRPRSQQEETAASSARSSPNHQPHKPPIKNLSALSLAMMMVNPDEKNGGGGGAAPSEEGAPPGEPQSTTPRTDEKVAEKRRAALHHAPPHQQPSAPSAGEYGYAYNSHIPSIAGTAQAPPPQQQQQQQHPSPHAPRSVSDGMPHSPAAAMTPLGSTPPGYLLGATPQVAVPHLSNLIPPRGAVTPPFTRPMGFVGEPPSQASLPPASSPRGALAAPADTTTLSQPPPQQRPATVAAPLTSLDLLHSSPFQQPVYGSMFGSVNAPGDPFGSMGSAGMMMMLSGDPTAPMMGSGVGGHSATMLPSRLQGFEDPDDMPFAVDSSEGTASGGGSGLDAAAPHAAAQETPSASAHVPDAGGTELAAAMASFATSSTMIRDMSQPPKRLQLFDSVAGASAVSAATHPASASPPDALSSLADQLAEFKSFGASLVVAHPGDPTTGGGGSSGEAGTAQPIPLRT